MPTPTERESEPSARARDHVCRCYRRRGEFVAHAPEFPAEGRHPTADEGGTPFHLHAHACDGSAAALDGDPDPASRGPWPPAPERAGLRPEGGTIAIDAAGPGFVGHRSLAGYAERHAATVVLRTKLSTPARLVELPDLPGMRVDRAA